jgi:hypothetical protein
MYLDIGTRRSERQAAAAFYSRERPDTHCTGVILPSVLTNLPKTNRPNKLNSFYIVVMNIGELCAFGGVNGSKSFQICAQLKALTNNPICIAQEIHKIWNRTVG